MTTTASSGDPAVARGDVARRRITALQQRRTEWAAGQPSSPATVEQARLHALEALRRVERAHRDAAVENGNADQV